MAHNANYDTKNSIIFVMFTCHEVISRRFFNF